MKVNLPVEEGYFHITSCTFCGIEGFLITPKIDAKWNKNNLFFRSIIVDKNNNVLSCGFPKFFNYGEKPECYPDPESFRDWKVEEKIDGSLLIVDYVNGQFSMRTRGTVSHITQKNAKDFEQLTIKHPKVKEFLEQNSHLSLLFEIVTPNNVIIVRPKDIEFYLIGAINKNGMVVVSSSSLTEIWRKIGPIPAPSLYEFNSVEELSKIAQHIKTWKGKEGVVISYNNGQNRIKLKSDWYCWAHKIKSQLSSQNNLIEYYIKSGMPDQETFFKKIETEFDYEIALQLKDDINKIVEAGDFTKKALTNMSDFANSIRGVKTRKEQAQYIFSTYGGTNRSSFVFNLLDGRELTKEQLIKLLQQFL